MVDGQKPKRLISWSDIRQHKTPENAWIVIHHKVYDVSGWDAHPGGHIVFTQAGEDATDAFAVFHPSSALKYLEPFYIGEVDESTKDQIEDEPLTEVEQAAKQRAIEFSTAYRKLRLQVKSMGLYNANPLYYLWKLVSTFAIALFSAYLCYVGQSLSIYLVAGAIMGLFYQQSGWLAHDFLHHQVTENRFVGDCFGILVGNIWQGFSVQWWKNKHNTHHAVPNLHGRQGEGFSGDPDIDTMPLLAWSKEMAQRATESTIGPFFIRYQAILYFPLLLFARLSWLVQSGMYVFQNFAFYAHDPVQHLRLEQIGLILHYTWNILLPYLCGMSIFEGISFFLMSQAICGLLLALVFSIGHNGMTVYERENKPDFWKLQVTTTRNITSSLFMDWFTGGLNYQIDHHLFPMIPRHNLHAINVLVKSLCKEFDIPYHETSFSQGLKEVIMHLGTISKEFITEFPAM